MRTGTPDNTDKEPTLSGLKATYLQNADSCDPEGGIQALEISTDDAGGGNYFVIETKRWAFDKIEDLINVLKDFSKRLK